MERGAISGVFCDGMEGRLRRVEIWRDPTLRDEAAKDGAPIYVAGMEMQVPPLRFAPVGMTNLKSCGSVGMTNPWGG